MDDIKFIRMWNVHILFCFFFQWYERWYKFTTPRTRFRFAEIRRPCERYISRFSGKWQNVFFVLFSVFNSALRRWKRFFHFSSKFVRFRGREIIIEIVTIIEISSTICMWKIGIFRPQFVHIVTFSLSPPPPLVLVDWRAV